jgi:acetyltransferase-like isoleucine patch superfamily enzyme
MIGGLKHFLHQLRMYIWNHWITQIPFYCIRHAYFVYVCGGRLGKQSSLLLGVNLKGPKRIYIGDNTVINSGVLLDGRGGLHIGNNVDIARDVIIWSLTHDPNSPTHSVVEGEVNIGDNVWIGARSQILASVTIGAGAVIGAGSIVTKDVAPGVIVAGVPAKQIGSRAAIPSYRLNHRPFFE